MKSKVVILTADGENNFELKDRKRIENIADVIYYKTKSKINEGLTAKLLRNAEYIAITPRVLPVLDENLLKQLRFLKGISYYANGLDSIDITALRKRNIKISNIPDYCTISVAEHTMGLILNMSRRIHLSSLRAIGGLPKYISVRGFELDGKTLGLIGLGKIGRLVAKYAKAFSMRVIGFDIHKIKDNNIKNVKLYELLKVSDIVSLHRSRVWNEKPQFSYDMLKKMKKNSILINSSRKDLVDKNAILKILKEGYLAGYAVDECVFSLKEAENLIRQGRILQTGHTAWYSTEAVKKGYSVLLNNLYWMIKDKPMNLVEY